MDDTNIQLEPTITLESVLDNPNDTTVADWLGRQRTVAEIKERNSTRKMCLAIMLCVLYVVGIATSVILTKVYSTPRGAPLKQPFIISVTFLGILLGPVAIILIGLATYFAIKALQWVWRFII